jgi:uncharacterized protein (TIGR02646 family)
MLNITTRISLSKSSKRAIRKLRAQQHGNFTTDSWGMINNGVKNNISKRLFFNQGLKCVYCERYLVGSGHEIDHFAHKGNYPEFTFISVNLFYSCRFCNSPGRKGQKNTIRTLRQQYNHCTFIIVHPFFDNPNIEIVFTDPDRIYFDRNHCSQPGRDTIDFFGWDDLIYSIIRSRILINERLHPLTSEEEIQLIQQSIAYR